jgi:hypothetical protein
LLQEDNKQITDEFQVSLTAQGMPYDVDKIGNIKTIFTDIAQDDVDAELFLTVRLVRRGKLSDAKDSKPGKVCRTLLCGIKLDRYQHVPESLLFSQRPIFVGHLAAVS